MKEVTVKEIEELLEGGMTKTEAGNELGISAQKVGSILAKAKKTVEVIEPELILNSDIGNFAKTYQNSDISELSNIVIMTAQEYHDYSLANGRFEGRELSRKTECSIEELRVLINSGRKPQYIMSKHGLDKEDFKQLVWALSKKELRDRPLKFDVEQDFIEVG